MAERNLEKMSKENGIHENRGGGGLGCFCTADDGLAHAMVGNRRMTQGDLVVGGGEKMGQLIET